MSSFFASTDTLGTIHNLLNAEDEKERDRLTERWRDNKLQELSFVGIVGGLLANVLTSTNSWPDVMQAGNRTPWMVRACWFTGIVFALAAVLTAASQSIRLHRISCRSDANAGIRALLSRKAQVRRGEVLPRGSHVYLWQMGVLYLMCSVFVMILGIFVLVWSAAGGENWWNGQAQLAITFTVVACAVGCMFCWEQFTLFSSDGHMELGNVSLE